MHVLSGNAEATTGAASPIPQRASSHHAHRANLTCVPNSRTLSHIRADPCSQQVLDGFVLKVLGHQVQLSEAFAEPIEHHRHRGFPYTHTSTGVSCLLIQPLRYSRFLTHPGYYPQMIQTLCLVLYFC